MEGVNKFGLPAWLLTIGAAYLVSTEAAACATFGFIMQWTLKAPAKVHDWIAPTVAVVVGGALYVFVLGHKPAALPPSREWIVAFVMWDASALGFASATGRSGGAPKTNTL